MNTKTITTDAWREAFAAAFESAAAAEGVSLAVDADMPCHWQAPWTWGASGYLRHGEAPQDAGRRWWQECRADIIAALEDEAAA